MATDSPTCAWEKSVHIDTGVSGRPAYRGSETGTRTDHRKGGGIMANIVWFEIGADNVERAKSFYGSLFGWKIEKMPGAMEYWHLDTGGSDDAPDGGLMKRQNPQQAITNYIGVPSVD